jgi:hypothetical protein
MTRDLEAALRNALRIVRPGEGILGTTTTGMTPLFVGYPENWRMSEHG